MEKLMENKYYNNGGEPAVGDIIAVSKANEFSYQSQLRRESSRNYQTRFEVTGITKGSKSVLLHIKEVITSYYYEFTSPMKCTNFDLIEAASTSNKSVPKYIVHQQNNLNSMFVARTDEELQKRLTKSLQENPMRKYHVYSYVATAQTEAPQIQMIDLNK